MDQLVKLGLEFAAEALPTVLTRAVQAELAEHGIEILRWKELSADERDSLG